MQRTKLRISRSFIFIIKIASIRLLNLFLSQVMGRSFFQKANLKICGQPFVLSHLPVRVLPPESIRSLPKSGNRYAELERM
jgi:hypothetical protein